LRINVWGKPRATWRARQGPKLTSAQTRILRHASTTRLICTMVDGRRVFTFDGEPHQIGAPDVELLIKRGLLQPDGGDALFPEIGPAQVYRRSAVEALTE
jgi:hypothetical protein